MTRLNDLHLENEKGLWATLSYWYKQVLHAKHYSIALNSIDAISQNELPANLAKLIAITIHELAHYRLTLDGDFLNFINSLILKNPASLNLLVNNERFFKDLNQIKSNELYLTFLLHNVNLLFVSRLSIDPKSLIESFHQLSKAWTFLEKESRIQQTLHCKNGFGLLLKKKSSFMGLLGPNYFKMFDSIARINIQQQAS